MEAFIRAGLGSTATEADVRAIEADMQSCVKDKIIELAVNAHAALRRPSQPLERSESALPSANRRSDPYGSMAAILGTGPRAATGYVRTSANGAPAAEIAEQEYASYMAMDVPCNPDGAMIPPSKPSPSGAATM